MHGILDFQIAKNINGHMTIYARIVQTGTDRLEWKCYTSPGLSFFCLYVACGVDR